MPFLTQATETTGSSANRLHVGYNQHTQGKSRLEDWRKLIQLAGDRGAWIIYRLATIHLQFAPPSRQLVSRWKEYLVDAERDPVIVEYPVTQSAREIADTLAYTGDVVEPEYVQQAVDRYCKFQRALHKEDNLVPLWVRLPPATDFTYEWFRVISPYGSPRMRQFSLSHNKFKQWVFAHCRVGGVREGDLRKCLDLLTSSDVSA